MGLAAQKQTHARGSSVWLSIALIVSVLLTLLPVTATRAAAPDHQEPGTSVAGVLDVPATLDTGTPTTYTVTQVTYDSVAHPVGFNNSGQLLLSNATIWENGTLSDISDSGAYSMSDSGDWLNDAGDAVLRRNDDYAYVLRKSDGSVTTIGSKVPTAFNNAGQLAFTNGDDDQAYRWHNGTMQPLGDGWPIGMNNNGDVVGAMMVDTGASQRQHAMLWKNSSAIDIHLSDWLFSTAWLINDDGDVIGQFRGSDSQLGVYHYNDGVATKLDAFTGEGSIVLRSINAAGQFIGVDGRYSVGTKAFVYDLDSHTLTYLNDAITTPGYAISSATHINDAGQIVAYAYDLTSGAHGTVLLTPTTSNECPLPPFPVAMTTGRSLQATTPKEVNGKVQWDPSVVGVSSVPAIGARVQIGCGVDEEADIWGDYSLSAEPGEQTMTASMELFTHEPTGASLEIVETMPVTVPEDGGELPAMTTFGKHMRLMALGREVPLLDIQRDEGSITAKANLPVNVEGNEVIINADVVWTKDPDKLTIRANTGTFQWQGQTLTITDFQYESPANTFTFKATGSFVIGGIQVNDVQMTATRDEEGVFHFDGSGQVLVQGATISFDSIKATSGSTTELHIRGRVTLPNQPAGSLATFETDITPGDTSLDVTLQNFVFNGVVASAELHYTSSPQMLTITGTARSQIGGADLDAEINTTIAPGNSTVAARVALALTSNGGDPVTIQADVLWNATTNQLTGTASATFPMTPCPGSSPAIPPPAYAVDVQLTISRSAITFSGSANIPLPCSFGANKSMTITVSSANQDLSVNATIPFTVQGLSGDLSAEFKVSDNDTRVMVGVQLGIDLSFLDLNRQQRFTPSESSGSALQATEGTLRIAVVDPLGLRTGYDPATGNSINEIPGATWSLDANGLDQISVPGFLGGYRVELYSTIDQTVTVTIHGDDNSSASITASLLANEPYYGVFGVSVGPNGTPDLSAGAIEVAPPTESDVSVTYTGATHALASNRGGLLLAATLVEPVDGASGDVRKASVRFVNRATGATLCEAAVGLVEQSDTRLGTGACLATGPLGKPGDSITVGIIVDGAYARDNAADDQTISLVGTPKGLAIVSGAMNRTALVGQLFGDEPASVGLVAIGTPLVNGVTITASQGSNRYVISSVAGTSFVKNGNQVLLTGRATIMQTSGLRRPVVIMRDALIQMTMTSSGSSKTTVALTVWDPDGGILLATGWDGVQSAETPLSKGTIRVR